METMKHNPVLKLALIGQVGKVHVEFSDQNNHIKAWNSNNQWIIMSFI